VKKPSGSHGGVENIPEMAEKKNGASGILVANVMYIKIMASFNFQCMNSLVHFQNPHKQQRTYGGLTVSEFAKQCKWRVHT